MTRPLRLLAGSACATFLSAVVFAQAQSAPPDACARLAALGLPDTTVTRAEAVAGPSFTPPSGRAIGNLPAFCRVAATSLPAVRFEVWLPLTGWNGKFQGVGNGANAGAISDDAMALALRRGYAVASTDTGHATTNGRDATWALGHPERTRPLCAYPNVAVYSGQGSTDRAGNFSCRAPRP